MTKCAVEEGKLRQHVIMPTGCDLAFVRWWKSIEPDTIASVRYPHVCHGLAGKPSNQAKTSVKTDILKFVDINRQPNGRCEGSSNPSHYFLPRFKTSQTHKKGVHHYQEHLEASVVCVFNRVQTEAKRLRG